MNKKIQETDFGKFTFLDEHVVVAEALEGVNIDGEKVANAVKMIEEEFPGDYAIILNRKSDYSVMPVEVYTFFNTLKRLRALAIVSYKTRDFLPEGMEKNIFERNIEKFHSVEVAHEWLKTFFSNKEQATNS